MLRKHYDARGILINLVDGFRSYCPDNAPDDDGEDLMDPVDGFRSVCPDDAGEDLINPVEWFSSE